MVLGYGLSFPDSLSSPDKTMTFGAESKGNGCDCVAG
ncbi:MAG: hypothetical protein RLZZ156_722 [Deinococcota bacterium]|jgi:hypothetical protein